MQSVVAIQFLRILGAVLVLNVHLNGFCKFGNSGVDLFLVISGFVIALGVSRGRTASNFVICRLVRIVPLYWVVTMLLFLAIKWYPEAFHAEVQQTASLTNLMKSLFFVPYRGAGGLLPVYQVGWALNYVMYFYLVIWVSMMIGRGRPLAMACGFLVVMCIVSATMLKVTVWGEFAGSPLVLEFILGVLAHEVSSRRLFHGASPVFLWGVLSGAVGAMVFMEKADCLSGRFLYFGIPSVFVVVSGVALESRFVGWDRSVNGLFHALGDASYSIYLTHPYLVQSMRRLHSMLPGELRVGPVVELCVAVPVILVAGWLVHRYCDQPLRVWLKNALAGGRNMRRSSS